MSHEHILQGTMSLSEKETVPANTVQSPNVYVTKLGTDGEKMSQKLDITTSEVEEPKMWKKIDVESMDGDGSGSESDDVWNGESSEDDSDSDSDSDNNSAVSAVSDEIPPVHNGGNKSSKEVDMSDTESSSSISTTDLLGRDPLFLVLSELLLDEEGNNLVHVLTKINKNLSKIAKALTPHQKHEKKVSKKNDS